MALSVELVSPERILFEGEADMVIARTIGGGDIAFLTGHAAFLGALDIYPIRLQLSDGTEEMIAVHGGFVQVLDDKVTILSDVAEVASQIDQDRARKARERAEALLAKGQDDTADAALKRAHLRINVSEGNIFAPG
jgi:F-type H+-transporting ATPase subunit epsilon